MAVNFDIIGKGWFFPFRFAETGGIQRASGIPLIKMSIRQIILTRIGSRVPLRQFGSPVKDLHFAPIQPDVGVALEHFIREAIDTWERRVLLNSVKVELAFMREGRLEISVSFTIRSTHETGSLVFPFYLSVEQRKQLGV